MLAAVGTVQTLAGQPNSVGFCDGVAGSAFFSNPYGICVSKSGHICISDNGNARIRCVESPEGPYYKLIDITKCLNATNVPATVDITINSVVYKLHRCLIVLRCPQLLKASLAKLPVDNKITQKFIQYIYNDELPKYAAISRTDRVEILGFSSLLYEAGFLDQALKCLEALSASCATLNAADLTPEDLVGLYSYSLDLAPFEIGANTCLNLLLSHKSSLPSKKFPELLKNHSDCLFELVQFLLEGNRLPLPSSSSGDASVATKCLNECLQTLLKTNNGADFEILVGNDKKKKGIACHSFVLYARWPYFKRLFDSGMSETKSKKLTLPAPGKDGGMPLVFLRAILEVCYQGILSPEMRKDLSPSVAMQALATRDLYVDDNAEDTFKYLIKFCQQQADIGLSVENCVDTYKVALELGVDAMAQKAKQLFVNNVKLVMKNPSQIETLFSLRESDQISLLWQAVFVISSKF